MNSTNSSGKVVYTGRPPSTQRRQQQRADQTLAQGLYLEPSSNRPDANGGAVSQGESTERRKYNATAASASHVASSNEAARQPEEVVSDEEFTATYGDVHTILPATDQQVENGLQAGQVPNITRRPTDSRIASGPFCCSLNGTNPATSFKIFRLREDVSSQMILRRFLDLIDGRDIHLSLLQRLTDTTHLVRVTNFQDPRQDFQQGEETQWLQAPQQQLLFSSDLNFAMTKIGPRRWVYQQIPYQMGSALLGHDLKVRLDWIVKCEIHNNCWEICVLR